MTLSDKIISIINGMLDTNATMESRFEEDLGADELDVAEIIMMAEEEFGIEIEEERFEKVKDLVGYVEERGK